jgi:hypothetical protein
MTTNAFLAQFFARLPSHFNFSGLLAHNDCRVYALRRPTCRLPLNYTCVRPMFLHSDNGDGYLAIVLNSVVHFVMYLYYLIVAVSSYTPPWKRCVVVHEVYMEYSQVWWSDWVCRAQVGHTLADGPICHHDLARLVFILRVPDARLPRHNFMCDGLAR